MPRARQLRHQLKQANENRRMVQNHVQRKDTLIKHLKQQLSAKKNESTGSHLILPVSEQTSVPAATTSSATEPVPIASALPESEVSNGAVPSTPVPDTPVSSMKSLLNSVNVKPCGDIVSALIPYAVTMDCVQKASLGVKKTLFANKSASKIRGGARFLSKKLHLSRDYVFHSRKVKNYAKARRAMVAEFLKREDNSSEMPSKKDHVKGRGRFGLTDTLRNLHCKFLSEHPDIKMSFSAFCSARPKYVCLVHDTQRRQCLCAKHSNMVFKLRVAKVLPKSTTQLVRMSDEDVKMKLKTMETTNLAYNQWLKENVKYKGNTIKKIKLCKVEESKSDFIGKFMKELPSFRTHCHRISEQYTQLRILKESLQPMQEVVVQIDYAENWNCKFMEEITGVYYDKNQITIHPMVLNYIDNQNKVSAMSFVGVTGERSHAVPTTFTFIKALIQDLHERLPTLHTIHFVSDSPSSQYRNRKICALMAKFPALFHLQSSWNWLESGHGKGLCDGVGGAIKRKADNTMEFCSAIRECETAFTILQISPESISSSKQEVEGWTTPAVKGLMAIHTIVPAGDMMSVRETSCFRPCCFEQGGIFHPTCTGWMKTKLRTQSVAENTPPEAPKDDTKSQVLSKDKASDDDHTKGSTASPQASSRQEDGVSNDESKWSDDNDEPLVSATIEAEPQAQQGTTDTDDEDDVPLTELMTTSAGDDEDDVPVG